MIRSLRLVIFFFLLTDHFRAQVCFAPEIVTFIKDHGQDIASGDFNNDGIPDLMATLGYINNVQMFKGLGTGSFVSMGTLYSSYSPKHIISGDFNNDGNLDFAVNNQMYSTSVFHGNGNFWFSNSTPTVVTSGWAVSGITQADFNNNGIIDLAVCYETTNNIGVLMGSGTTYIPPNALLSTGNEPMGIVAADFDGDGSPDIATANASDSTVSLRFGNGAGGFSPVSTFSTGPGPGSLMSDDFNGDGRPDLVTCNCTWSTNSVTISMLLNNGQGGFSPAQNLFVGNCPSGIASGDFNGDGNRDLVVTLFMGQQVAVMPGNGLGGFLQPVYFPTSDIYPSKVITNDFNGDGKDDFAIGYDGQVGVFLNTSTFLHVAASSSAICPGESATIHVSGSGKSYSWSTGSTDTAITVAPLFNTAYTVSSVDSNGCINTAVFALHVDACAGFNSIAVAHNDLFTSYPNPAHGARFTVRSEADLQVSIIDLAGQLVKTLDLNAANQHSITISDLPPGSYLLSAQNGGVKTVRKIMLGAW